MPRVQCTAGSAAAVAVQLALLAGLEVTAVDLLWPAWCAALGVQLAGSLLLRRALAGAGRTWLGPADLVTVARSVLVCAVVGLAVQSWVAPVPGGVVAALGSVALALDLVDGWVARRTGTASAVGARFDMEVDAVLILALSAYVGHQLGWWVLLSGLARYLLVAALAVWPALRGEVAPRRWRKVVAATQGVALVVAASGLLPRSVAIPLVAVALGLLVASFATEVAERRSDADGAAAAALGSPVVTGLAAALVWVALAMPDGARHLSPWLVARVPLEGMVLVVAAVLLSARWADRMALVFGLAAAVLLALKAVNVGFTMVLDRRFDAIGDWFYLGAAFGVLEDSVGRPATLGIGVGLGGVCLALLVALPRAARRVSRLARHRPGPAVGLAAALTVVAVVLSALRIGPPPYYRALSTDSVGVAVAEVATVRADLRDRAVFAAQIEADPYAGRDGLLDRLRGKDVLVVYVESYGRSALEGTPMAPGVTAVLDAGTARLRGAGYHARSAFLTSPTFGAASWLAHATTQSGLWVTSQRRYTQVVASDRLTVSRAFHEAGWRTVFVIPSVTRDWSEGRRLYRFDRLYDARTLGYRGPRFGYATMPDQYTLAQFQARELAPADRPPVMAEIDLVSSHHPWAPLPTLVPWSQVGDGSVFEGMPERGRTAEEVLGDPDLVREAYGQSVEYTLATLVSFLLHAADDDLVVIMLGDHQPHHYVSGDRPGYDVPVSVIARDPAVMSAIAGWGWSEGLHPPTNAPVWRMDTLRDRLFAAFSTPEGTPR